ncbi:MAG: hypothetical protein H7Y20_15410 [Bryobacteraceae bacterium]|nr:hypothetical protein [Bryobacteraceae bacterium]
MRSKWIVRLAKIVIFLLAFVAGFGQSVLHLWNWLVPNIFGLRPITFWEAVGLLGLSWILFGGLRGGPGYARAFGSAGERWRKLSSEQREHLRHGLRGAH